MKLPIRLCLITNLLLVAIFGLSQSENITQAQEDDDENEVLVIAHQGGDGLYPSNTMLAFEGAVEMGVDMLELDIHSTADGVLVVIHDDTVDRTTDGEGAVLDFTFEELQELDAGYHWPTLAEEADREDRPYRGQDITIPALEEVFEAFPDMPMTIEIKQREPSIVIPFCEMLEEYDMKDQVIVASFHVETLEEFREDCPDVPTSGSEDEIQSFYLRLVTGGLSRYETDAVAFQVPEYSGDLHVVTEDFIEGAHEKGILVQVWTVNDPEQIERMLDLGVDGIITDYPDRVFEAIEARETDDE